MNQSTNVFGTKPQTGVPGIFNNAANSTTNNSMNGVNNIFTKPSTNNSAQGPTNIFGQTGSMGMGGNMQYNSGGFGSFAANNSKPAETNKGIFASLTNNTQNQGVFGAKPTGINQQSTGIFPNPQTQQGISSAGIFSSAGQKNSLPTSQGIFSPNNQGGFFGGNNMTAPFNQTNNMNSPFSQNNASSPFNNASNSPFGNNNNTQISAFGMMGNNANQIFQNNANQGNTNMFGPPNQQMNQNVQGGVLMGGNQNMQQQPQFQPQLSSLFQVPQGSPLTNEMISSTNSMYHTKLLLEELSKRISSHSLEGLKIHDSNTFGKALISQLPYKQQIFTLLRNKRILSKHIEKLERDQINLVNLNREWSMSFSLKLARYKEMAIESIKSRKMIEQVKEEIEQMEKHINNFIKPLFNAAHYKTGVSFMDPDQFCMEIARKVHSRMRVLEQKADDLISANNIQQEESVDSLQVLSNLGQYFEQVAGQLKNFESRYHEMKKIITQKRLFGNLDEILRRGREKQEGSSGYSHFKLFQLLKQIQKTLIQRQEALQSKNDTLLKLNTR